MAVTVQEIRDSYEKYKIRKTASDEKGGVVTAKDIRDSYELYKRYNDVDTSYVNDAYVNTFLSDANGFLGGKTERDSYSKWKDLTSRADTISGWLYHNRKTLDADIYDRISGAVSTFTDATKGFSSYETEDDYLRAIGGWLNTDSGVDKENAALRGDLYEEYTKRLAELNEELPWYAGGVLPNFAENIFLSSENEKKRDEMERLKAETKQYDRTQGVLDRYYTEETPEFLESAAKRDYHNATREELESYDHSVMLGSGALGNGGYMDDDGNIYDASGNLVQSSVKPVVEDKLGLFLSAGDDEITEAMEQLQTQDAGFQKSWATYVNEGRANSWRYLSEHEINIYYDLYNREGQEAAYRYLDAMTTELNRRETAERTEKIQNADGIAQLGLNIASVPMNIFGGLASFIDDTVNVMQGEDINPYSQGHQWSNAASDIRGKTAGDIEEATGNAALPWLGMTFGDVYQSLMSAADSAVGIFLGGNAYGVLMGTGAASSTAKELYEKGASPGQMVAGGLLAGVAEMIFEKYSIDNLVEMKDPKRIRDVIINTLKQGGVEASEEAFTEIANTITDYLVMGSQSEWTDLETFVKNVVNAGLGGFLSGGAMGGAYSSVNHAMYQQDVKQYGKNLIEQNAVDDLKASAKTFSENKEINRLLEKVNKKTKGKTVGALGIAVRGVTDARDRTEIKNVLTERGLSNAEAQTVTDFFMRVKDGYQPSETEIKSIEKITDKLPDVAEPTAQNVETEEVTPPTETTVKETAVEETMTAEDITESAAETEKAPLTLEEASKKYGAQAGAMVHTYVEGQDVGKYDAAYGIAYDMGKSGVSQSYAMKSEATSFLTERQRELAYEAGKAASNTAAKAQDVENRAKANGKTGRKKGTVRGQGVKIADLKKAFNDTQGTAFRLLSTYAEATGINIVLYRSEANSDGNYASAQGSFRPSNDTIYLDINAGLRGVHDVNELSKYTVMRTFAHEFTHFLEKWNPVQYNEFRKVVFEALSEQGEDVHELIEEKQARLGEGITYDEASREVVAEAMTDILPDANFVSTLAEKHKSIFAKLLEKLKEFVSALKAHFASLSGNLSREATLLKKQTAEGLHYAENIVELFDRIAVEAVEAYQMTVATKAKADTEVTKNAERQTESKDSKRDPAESLQRTSGEEGNRSEVQRGIGENQENTGEPSSLWEGQRKLNNKRFPDDAFILPKEGSAEEAEYKKLAEYGIEGYVVKKDAWDRGNLPAFSNSGRIYICEGIPEKYRGILVPHEATHVMAHLEYRPYLDFLARTADMVNTSTKEGLNLIEAEAEHYNIDIMNADDNALGIVYDEINATIYSAYVSGLIVDDVRELFEKSFYDFDAYIKELSEIHEQFKKENNPVSNELKGESKAEKPKSLRTKKSGWTAHDIEWHIPGKKTPIAYSTRAVSDLIEALAEDNPTANISELLGKVTYDVEAKKVLQQYIDAGYGSQVANEWFNHNKQEANTNGEILNADEQIVNNQGVKDPGKEPQTSSEKLADSLLNGYINIKNLVSENGKALTSKELYALADEAFGGTQAEGKYDRKDAYDAMELAVNKFLLNYAAIKTRFNNINGNATQAASAVKRLEHLIELLPTQNVRTQEMEDFQQFSTPPNIAYLAAWSANISANDFVLEPSAGIGGLAVFAKAWGAEVAVNELSKRRFEVLRSMGFDHMFNENAEHIDDILPDNIKPSVVIMNPPFSSTAGRTQNNKTSNAEKHIDSALARLRDGGRLVAILGKGMNDADYYRYWDKLRKTYTVRANLSIDGENYKKYGTTWGVQLVVIDKIGPQTGETLTGKFTDLTEIPKELEGIKNDRRHVEEYRSASGTDGERESVSRADDRQSDRGHDGSDKRADGGASVASRKADRKNTQRDSGNGDRADGAGSAKAGGEEALRKDGRGNGDAGRRDPGDGNGTAAPSGAHRSEPELSSERLTEEIPSDDGVYSTFIVPKLPISGGKRHPAVLVESAAMAAVSMPEATYKPSLPPEVIRNNLSDAQLVTVTYAGQAHAQKLPDGTRKGFFIGDGTGVGKGRQIAGIILDNFMQGRKKAVWISKNNDLYGDAIRDWTATSGRSKEEIVSHNKIKPKEKIALDEGILYSTYDTLKSEKGGNRLEQIVEWLGKDFDGVIAFDEAHNMGNLFGKSGKFGKSKGSEKAKAGVELQRLLPNARIVYVSATAATEVENLAYAERIGLWGRGTSFNDAKDFIAKIGSSGLAAMELVIRDMKAMGSYVARSISYNGVNYETVEHQLDPMQTEIYNTMSRAWQKTMTNALNALEVTGGKHNSTERQRALGNFYSAMQRFYNQVLTSMSMPSVIADMRKELANGHSCVLQIVNTNEAQQNKQLAEAKAKGESLDNLDLTPRESLIGYLMSSFPTQMFEEYTDDDGNLRSRPVMDSHGKPVYSKEAMRQRDALIAEVESMSIPDGPLEMLFDAFGADAVAENTGRSRRVVPKKMADGSVARVEERRTLNHRTADVQAFQDGKKRILVFSDAGGTGKSYHADRSEKNQQLRIHYVLQPGWVASNAVQGFGRTHRSNEASAPIYKLVTTNIKGQKRFTSTIARRLDQLGALTKGQRDTGSGMFGAKDNLETDLARDSLREFYKRLGKNQIEGIDGMKTLDRLGLKHKFTDEFGAFKLNDVLARDIGTFLNRILALEVDEQNTVFDAFISIYEMELEAAIQAGTLDTGMENVKADKIEIVDDKVIRKGDNAGSSTHYIQAKTYTKPKIMTTVAQAETHRAGFVGIYRLQDGSVRAVYRMADKTTEWGAVQKQYRLVSPNLGAKTSVMSESSFENKAALIEKADWQKEWDAEVSKVPEYNENILHMLTGALLPIWNTLPQEGSTKVKRLIASDGATYLGRVIEGDMIDTVLGHFSVDRTREVFTASQVMDRAIKDGVRFTLLNNRAEIFRSRVSGEWRLEITQQNAWYLKRQYPELISERIQYRDRYFIPVGEKGLAILEKLLTDNPVRHTTEENAQYQQRTYTYTDREVLEMAANALRSGGLSDGEADALSIFEKRLSALRELEDKRKEQGVLYRELQFGVHDDDGNLIKKPDREAAETTLNRMHILDDKIKAASDAVLSVENKAVLKAVLVKARKIVEAMEREHGKELLHRYRERRENAAAIKKYKDRIRKDVNDLSDWMLHPNNKDIVKHIPDALKDTVIPFLTSINFMSRRALSGEETTAADRAFLQRLESIKTAFRSNIDIFGLYSGYNDLPPNFMDTLQAFIDTARNLMKDAGGEFVINKMSLEELVTLSGVIRILKKHITEFNRFHANAMYQHVYEAGNATVEALQALGSNSGSVISEFVFWQQMRPAYAFERFGDGGVAIYDGLRRGQSTLAFHTKEIIAFAENTYTDAEVKAWEKEIKEIRLGGDVVKMPVSAIMSLYKLSARPQAMKHILSGGVRVATFKNGKEKISDVGHALTKEDVERIVDILTPRQKAVADALQSYMQKQGGTWGNYVSVRRFGEELFGEEHYFPINSDGRHLQALADEQPSAASLYALLNMGFTKAVQEEASNRLILYSIFDVFSNHMASMAQYNALALPVLDALKWFNYRQFDVDENGMRTLVGSVREEMARAFGAPEENRPGSGRQGYAESFVINILKAFNGTEAQGIPTDTKGIEFNRRYNMAQVAFNFRAAVQQPLAITRAALLVDYGSIMKGMKLSPSAIKKNVEEMQKYSGIAAWKSLGFYDTNISRGLTDLIKHNATAMDKISDAGMWLAEKADTLTWASIWSACKEQVKKQKRTFKSEDAFFEVVVKLFEEVIYKTQVVDSVLTKNEFLRSKGAFARLMGSFMSEPTTTASMLLDAYDKYHMDMQRGMTRQEAWKKHRDKIGRTMFVYALGAVLLAAVQAIPDALRDDDDYENFFEKLMSTFVGNAIDELMPFNKLPYFADVYDLVKELISVFGIDTYGNPPQSVFMQWWGSLVNGTKIIYDKIVGESTNYTWYGGIYKLLQAAAGMTGLPIATVTREVITIWNNTVGAMAPSLKVKTYEASDRSTIAHAFKDGYLTAEEAAKKLSETEGASVAKSEIGTWYRGGKIAKTQAVTLLRKYADMDDAEITKTVNKWSCVVVTGIPYDEIDDRYLSGEISRSRAIEMYMRYGTMTREEAAKKVSRLK